MTQLQDNVLDLEPSGSPTIRRLRKEEAKEEPALSLNVRRYNGPEKPVMPETHHFHPILSLRVLAAKVISVNRAQEIDLSFLHNITHTDLCPEYNGFDTEIARSQGHTVKPATKAIYTPLIDMKPSDPDTIMTAMVESQEMTESTGQVYTIFTTDQQLYRVAVGVHWAYPEQFQNFVPCLGGMHMLMSFIGAVGTLMENSGLEELMNSTFGGVQQMLTGKKFPQNLRALRMVVEELLRDVTPTCKTYMDLMSELDKR